MGRFVGSERARSCETEWGTILRNDSRSAETSMEAASAVFHPNLSKARRRRHRPAFTRARQLTSCAPHALESAPMSPSVVQSSGNESEGGSRSRPSRVCTSQLSDKFPPWPRSNAAITNLRCWRRRQGFAGSDPPLQTARANQFRVKAGARNLPDGSGAIRARANASHRRDPHRTWSQKPCALKARRSRDW